MYIWNIKEIWKVNRLSLYSAYAKCTDTTAFHSHTIFVVCYTDSTYDNVHWRAGQTDVVEPIEAQHKQNAVHVVWQQTASREGTEAMSYPESRWRRDRVLYRISLPRCCVRSWITFAVQIRQLAGKCFYHLRKLWTVRRTVTTDAGKTVVPAFIPSRMDYCNIVLAMPVLFICTHFNRCCTLLRASSRGKESITIFLQLSVISYTGCQLNNGLTTHCALLFASAYTM